MRAVRVLCCVREDTYLRERRFEQRERLEDRREELLNFRSCGFLASYGGWGVKIFPQLQESHRLSFSGAGIESFRR